jgi:hypothetical protein
MDFLLKQSNVRIKNNHTKQKNNIKRNFQGKEKHFGGTNLSREMSIDVTLAVLLLVKQSADKISISLRRLIDFIKSTHTGVCC